MDGTLSGLTRLKGVTPNPYELRWDNAAWLAGGERLAIARMNAREGSAGSTLYVLDGQSGQVQLSLPWPAASSQSAPWVEWLNSSELLLNGGSKLSIVNVSTDPPKVIDVMHDLLKLDLAYPDEISAMTSVSDPATGNYYLAVRANHPRNVSLSLYSSATGKTQVFTSSDDYLLIFPNGEVDEMPRMPSVSSHQDQYDLLWVDQPAQTAQALSVAGHTPRSYPALYVTPAPGGDALYFGSSQGVSLVSFPEGKMLAFWDLGGQTAYVTAPKHARAGQRVVAVVDRVGLFIIPLFK